MNDTEKVYKVLENELVAMHDCNENNCDIEMFQGTWPGAVGTYYRCKIKRLELEEIALKIVNSLEGSNNE